MNILYLTSGLEMGGTELFVLDLAKEAKTAGNVVVWGSVKNGSLKSFILDQGIELENCCLERRPFPRVLSAIAALRKTVRKYNIEVIHSVDAYSALMACLAFGKSSKKPKLVWTNVGIGIDSYGKIKKMCEPVLDAITTETHYVRNRLIEAEFDPNKIFVCYRCRPMKAPSKTREEIREKLNIEKTDYVIGSVGRLDKAKGNETIIKALPAILKKHPHVKFLIVGDGKEKESLTKLAKQLNVQNNIVFYGFCSNVEDLYGAMDMVVFPTYCEALGHICFEAMFFEKPLVASFTTGIIETITNEVNGLLVPPAMVENWAEAIVRIIDDPELSQRLVKNGATFMENMKKQNELAIKQIFDIYNNLIQEK